jgi:hypothetical protein
MQPSMLGNKLKIIMKIVNDTSHNHAKSQLIFLCQTNMTKSGHLWRFENELIYTILSFLCSLKYKVLEIDILHA